MLKFTDTAQFRRDLKRVIRRGYDPRKLQSVIDMLLAQAPLEPRHRDHALSGAYTGFRECHIQPDWLLIYFVDSGRLILVASRTGTHSDLFDE